MSYSFEFCLFFIFTVEFINHPSYFFFISLFFFFSCSSLIRPSLHLGTLDGLLVHIFPMILITFGVKCLQSSQYVSSSLWVIEQKKIKTTAESQGNPVINKYADSTGSEISFTWQISSSLKPKLCFACLKNVLQSSEWCIYLL